jgi:hypothetical protein
MSTNFLAAAGQPGMAVGSEVQMPVASSAKIYQYAHVCIQTSSGCIVRASDTSGLIYCGVSLQLADNTSGAAAAISAMVEALDSQPFYFMPVAAGVTAPTAATYVGEYVYLVDDNGSVVLAAGSTNKVIAGRCIQIVNTTGGLNSNGFLLVDRSDRGTLAST